MNGSVGHTAIISVCDGPKGKMLGIMYDYYRSSPNLPPPSGYIFCEGQSFEEVEPKYPELVKFLRSCGYAHLPDARQWAGQLVKPKCECGAHKADSPKHAYWCELFKP